MYYVKDINATLLELKTSRNGLKSDEVKERIEKYGKNQLPQPKKITIFHIFFSQFKSPIIYILLIAAIISFLIGEYSDAGFIAAVLLINAIIGTYQEYTAAQKADSLKKIIKTYVQVLRDGRKVELESTEITIGDILYFESGVKIPADVRLIQTNELTTNESLITGESIDVLKDASVVCQKENIPLGDRHNMLYAGSTVTKGRGIGVVTAIGLDTEIGKIASLVTETNEVKTPLLIRMEDFSLKIAKIIIIAIMLIIAIGIYQNIEPQTLFFFAVALAVSTIPEGLPVAITVVLGVASIAMSKRNVIVQKLSAIEGLGSCTFIASDKTGTMTKNELSVKHFITQENDFNENQFVSEKVMQCAILCNEVHITPNKDGYHFLGDQVDIAQTKYVLNQNPDMLQLKELELIDSIPYEPINKYSAVSYKLHGEKVDFIKGAPEVILKKCALDDLEIKKITSQVDKWASKGFRTIALAYSINELETINTQEYIYLGFSAIIDPLREGVKESIQKVSRAGVEVAMVTGDHPNTAFSIAQELGIAKSFDEVIDGEDIASWEENGAKKEEIANKRVFARVSPEQKQLIVKSFQDLEYFVAVTGDGVNDAPALNQANIGISMGKSGTDVARESSDLILTDDAFSSIVNGIEEGRIAYNNIRKVVHLLISTGFAELVLIILSMLFHTPIPLLPVQLLWLNLVTNGIQHVALSFEKAEDGILRKNPPSPKEAIFNKVMISRVIIGGMYMGITAFIVFYTLLQYGYSEDMARNITLLLMVLFENVHVFNSRSEDRSIFKINHLNNKFLWITVIIAQLIHIISMYIPFMQSLLHLQPVDFQTWLILLAIALVLIGVMEIEKLVRKGYQK